MANKTTKVNTNMLVLVLVLVLTACTRYPLYEQSHVPLRSKSFDYGTEKTFDIRDRHIRCMQDVADVTKAWIAEYQLDVRKMRDLPPHQFMVLAKPPPPLTGYFEINYRINESKDTASIRVLFWSPTLLKSGNQRTIANSFSTDQLTINIEKAAQCH